MSFSSRAKKYIAADTLALLVFDISTGFLVVVYEWLVVGFHTEELLLVRLLYMSKFLGARLCGRLTDVVRRKILGTSKNVFRKGLADTLAVSLYQAPLYALSAWIVGMQTHEILTALSIYFVNVLLLGWVYGVVLDYMRRRVVLQK